MTVDERGVMHKLVGNATMTLQEFDTTVELEEYEVGMGMDVPTEEDGDRWFWDTDFTLADILPQIYSTENGPAQMEQCGAKDANTGEDIDWVLILSLIHI